MPLTDATPMPFGRYKGTAMANVPAKYLLWLYNQGCDHVEVKRYIIANLEILNREISRIPR